MIITATDPTLGEGEFILLKGVASNIIGAVVTYAPTTFLTTLVPNTANLSARLCGVAEPGQILVSEWTLARLGNRFEVDELPPQKIKGKEKPVRIFNVKRDRSATARME